MVRRHSARSRDQGARNLAADAARAAREGGQGPDPDDAHLSHVDDAGTQRCRIGAAADGDVGARRAVLVAARQCAGAQGPDRGQRFGRRVAVRGCGDRAGPGRRQGGRRSRACRKKARRGNHGLSRKRADRRRIAACDRQLSRRGDLAARIGRRFRRQGGDARRGCALFERSRLL